MTPTPEALALLEEVLLGLHRSEPPYFPEVRDFRLRHEPQRVIIDELVKDDYLLVRSSRYGLTIKGLLACRTPQARRVIQVCDALLPVLKDAYRADPARGEWSFDELVGRIVQHRPHEGWDPQEIGRALLFLVQLPLGGGWTADSSTGLIKNVHLTEAVLDAQPIGWPDEPHEDEEGSPAGHRISVVQSIEVSGYRPFCGFRAAPGELTVIIGSNASGKTSLFDVLRFMSFAASNPLPPEIDPGSAGRSLFHAGGPERISLALVVSQGEQRPVRYEVDIQGPQGVPQVVRERLALVQAPGSNEGESFIFLDFHGGKGVVRDRLQRTLTRPPWTMPPNELALRRALDPTLVTLASFQSFLSSWRFYSGFDISADAIRRPVPTEPSPTLAANGANLSAVLHSLMTEHAEAWQELETHLRSAIPGFQSLNVKARGGPGTVMGIWRERDIAGELTLADLSDGTLRLLCWAALCLSPGIPQLVCIDEPELGLHPRVLPVLAGLLRLASARSQVLVATHSPYLLSQFALDEIAVMRKEGGRAVLVRPGDSQALRREVEEIGGAALAQLHISDELEVRS